MKSITFSEFKNADGNPMTGVCSKERKFFQNGQMLAVAAVNHDDTKTGIIIKPGVNVTDQVKKFTKRKTIEDVKEWIEKTI